MVDSREVVGLLWPGKADLRVAHEVMAKRRSPAAGGANQEEVRKPAGFGLVQEFTSRKFGYDSKTIHVGKSSNKIALPKERDRRG
jgi:hypothetical protein